MALSGTDTSTAIDLARILVGMVALGVASLTDLRTRRVPNRLWYIVAGIGIGLLVVDLTLIEGASGWHLLMAFPVAAVFAVTVTGGELWPVMPDDEEDPERELTPSEARTYIVDLVVSGVLVASSIAILVLARDHVTESGDLYAYIIGSVLTIGLALALYMTRVLHGGGDAKALMTLAVIFPVAPLADKFPIIDVPQGLELFPFSLGVLINAAIITALSPIAFIIMSALRGPLRFPEALFGFPVPVDQVERGQLWLMYETAEGSDTVTRRMWPRRSKEAEAARAKALAIIKGRGDERAYVSPKIPFMVPLFIGMMVALFLGNVLMQLVWAFMG